MPPPLAPSQRVKPSRRRWEPPACRARSGVPSACLPRRGGTAKHASDCITIVLSVTWSTTPRYAEALARYGDGDGLLAALALVNPIGLKERVPSAGRRQSNCYWSSSDAAFGDRYEAEAHYDRIRRGEVALEGGWRVYSSGPGVFLRLVVESMLGIRRRGKRVEIDPVLPRSLNGLQARISFDGAAIDVTYRVGAHGVGPTAVALNGVPLPTKPLTNPYRAAGVSVSLRQLSEILAAVPGRLDVEVS